MSTKETTTITTLTLPKNLQRELLEASRLYPVFYYDFKKKKEIIADLETKYIPEIGQIIKISVHPEGYVKYKVKDVCYNIDYYGFGEECDPADEVVEVFVKRVKEKKPKRKK